MVAPDERVFCEAKMTDWVADDVYEKFTKYPISCVYGMLPYSPTDGDVRENDSDSTPPAKSDGIPTQCDDEETENSPKSSRQRFMFFAELPARLFDTLKLILNEDDGETRLGYE
jgi:hypothetical protein